MFNHLDAHQLTVQQLVQKYAISLEQGLSHAQALKRLAQYGPNELPQEPADPWIILFLRQFKSPLVYILLIAACLMFFISHDHLDALVVSCIIFINAVIGALQESRARSILQGLQQFVVSECVVIRDGKKQIIPNKELVPGDIIIVQAGFRVPADARILQAQQVHVDESILSGESFSVYKDADIVEDDAPLFEQSNMLFKGTYVLSGWCKAVVVATGINTQIGKIHKTAQTLQAEMPLNKEISRLSYWILIASFVLSISVVIMGVLNNKPFHEIIVIATALFICIIPEGLPLALSIALVTGAERLARKKVLVRNMQIVEGLGHADVIFLDKTGTLTRNELMVTELIINNQQWSVSGTGYYSEGVLFSNNKAIASQNLPPHLIELGVAASLLNSADIQYQEQQKLFTIKGDPTEAALYVLSQKMGLSHNELVQQYHELYEIPFNTQSRYHAGFYKNGTVCKLFVIGAPEVIMSYAQQRPNEALLHDMVHKGLRVIAVASKSFDCSLIPKEHQESFFVSQINELTVLGFAGIQDSVRPEAQESVQKARDAGIKVIMLTGDHKDTALYIAKQTGVFQEGDESIEGTQFAHLSDEEFFRTLSKITVYARMNPEQKVRVISLCRKLGYVVAMTGDGVNDVPSLAAADVAIAMGQSGTEAAKEASDLILLDDSFTSIVHAIEQGRHMFSTLRRVILYFFATNIGEVLIIVGALFLQLPLPITAVQILWLNLVTDGFLDIALSMESQEKGLLRSYWRRAYRAVVDKALLGKILFLAMPMVIGSLYVFYTYYAIDLVYAQTMTLVTMAMFQWFNAWNCRSEEKSIFQVGLFSNKWLLAATLLVLILQVMQVYVPWMQSFFKTVPISPDEWLFITAISSSILWIEELRKFIVRRRSAIYR